MKLAEFTAEATGAPIAFNIDKILYIEECEDGTTEMGIIDNVTIIVRESYTTVYNILCQLA